MKNRKRRLNECEEAIQEGMKSFRKFQQALRKLKAPGAADTQLKARMVEAGLGGVSPERVLAAETLEQMLACIPLNYFAPERN